jgi:hypothetical protein
MNMRTWTLILAAILGVGIIGAGTTYAAQRHNGATQLVKKAGNKKHHHKKHGKHHGKKTAATS